MKKRHAIYLMLAAICLLAAGCSKKGAAMPKHRKRKHCDCPYFSQRQCVPTTPGNTAIWQS